MSVPAGMTRESYDLLMKVGVELDPEEQVRALINSLLATLFRPVCEEGRARWVAHVPPELRDALVNWGDIGCIEVKRLGENGFLAYVEEANAPELERWLEEWASKWGWDVEVKTEW